MKPSARLRWRSLAVTSKIRPARRGAASPPLRAEPGYCGCDAPPRTAPETGADRCSCDCSGNARRDKEFHSIGVGATPAADRAPGLRCRYRPCPVVFPARTPASVIDPDRNGRNASKPGRCVWRYLCPGHERSRASDPAAPARHHAAWRQCRPLESRQPAPTRERCAFAGHRSRCEREPHARRVMVTGLRVDLRLCSSLFAGKRTSSAADTSGASRPAVPVFHSMTATHHEPARHTSAGSG